MSDEEPADDTRADVKERLARTGALPEVGRHGLQRLLASRVLVVGCGGLGHPVATYLAGAGVGHLTLVDDDDVDPTNLNRQVQFGVEDVGRPKVEALHGRLRGFQPHLSVAPLDMRLTARNAAGLVRGHDVAVDATDDPVTKFALHDACLGAGVPLVHGGAIRWRGQVTVIAAGGKPCLRCLFEEVPPAERCHQAGVLGAGPGAVGAVMAAEVVKLVLKVGETLVGRLLTLDLLAGTSRVQPLYARPGCPSCAAAGVPVTRKSRTPGA
jgi:adenylyltransferase/sulfurtransferase